MSTEWDEVEDTELDDVEDPGLAGGGGPAATIYGDDDNLDERGDDILRVDDTKPY
jgi:hypothetical protein